MSWFKVASDHLAYRGRLSREPYLAWTETDEGRSIVDARASRDRLWIFAQKRAQRRIWRELDRAGRSDVLRGAIQAEADRFAALLADASHAPGLPRRTIALHRLVILPRALVAARARTGARKRLYEHGALEALDPKVRDFFFVQLAVELDAALGTRRPTPSRPVLAHEGWRCIGRDTDYQWIDPIFSGPGWEGHLLMFEFPRQGLPRSARKELERGIQDLRGSLKDSPHAQRHEIMRMAADGLPRTA
jgi:hypothetical protein